MFFMHQSLRIKMISFFYSQKKMNIVDAQNASLSGGVAVGAIAHLMLQPYGALLIGSAAGILSTVGYQIIQVIWKLLNFFKKVIKNYNALYILIKQGWLQDVVNLHDSCGVNNLHGMPGIFSTLLSALFCGIASEATYGVR